ncbi:hypothetical protein [Massilia niastensis]|uniref:hypothetical protein n=1 Tax=Massilia niastensis TaxID=544911 RepID=UPI000364A642|nr:hypothetical protein [Massilia niastensis]
MENWNTALQRGLISGTASSLISTAALAALGKKETGSPYAATNAVSHYIHGDKAARHDEPSMRYTVPGYLIHHASATFWSVLFERFLGGVLDRKSPVGTLASAAATTAFAAFADYKLTPRRLQPGYEKRLSKQSLAVVYGGFALGLAIGAMMSRRDQV